MDTITASVTAAEKDTERHRVTFACACTNQRGDVVIEGTALVIAPTEKVKRPRAVLPEVYLFDRGARLRRLIESTKGLEPIRVAVVHPVDRAALLGALDAAAAGLLTPILVGPEARIRRPPRPSRWTSRRTHSSRPNTAPPPRKARSRSPANRRSTR